MVLRIATMRKIVEGWTAEDFERAGFPPPQDPIEAVPGFKVEDYEPKDIFLPLTYKSGEEPLIQLIKHLKQHGNDRNKRGFLITSVDRDVEWIQKSRISSLKPGQDINGLKRRRAVMSTFLTEDANEKILNKFSQFVENKTTSTSAAVTFSP